MTKLKLFQDTVCEVMNLAGGKCLVRDSKGEELEVYEYELSPIPLSKELLEYLGFRFDKEDYTIKGWECYKLTKINRVYFTPAIFIESKELTPPIGYVVTEDGEQRFSISLQHRKNFVDNRIGTCWVDDLGEFLYLCERLGCRVEVDIVGLEVFLQAHEEDLILNRWSTPKILP